MFGGMDSRVEAVDQTEQGLAPDLCVPHQVNQVPVLSGALARRIGRLACMS